MGTGRAIFKPVLNTEQAILGWSNKNCGNLAIHTNGDISKALKNRENLAETLKIAPRNLIFLNQIHSDKIEILKIHNQILQPCDSVITNLKNIALCVMVADCMPVILYSKKCVAAVHAGRSGVLKHIISKTINLMKDEFKVDEISLLIGPFIQKNCYEIGDLDLKEFNKFVVLNDKNKRCFDLKSAVLDEIKNLNLKSVEISKICTHCDKNYFSYRRDKITGRFAGWVYLK